MAIELKQSLKLSQQLLITPQLQQAIKLLQLSRLELVETVQKELLENPVLEESPDHELPETAEAPLPNERLSDQNSSNATVENTLNSSADANHRTEENADFDWGNYVESYNNFGREHRTSAALDEIPNYENTLTRSATLTEHLEWQLSMQTLTPEELDTCLTLVGNLDENGYLTAPIEELAEKTNHSLEELEDSLCVIQDLDPLGVGARNLQECLILQVKLAGADRKILTEIITEHLNLVERKDFPTLARKLALPLKRVLDLAQVIRSLEPKPGRPFGGQNTQYITPDVYIRQVGAEYMVVLNEDGLPKLQISNFYKDAIRRELRGTAAPVKSESQTKAQNYIQDKLKSALWLIKSIHQRQKTLYKVTKCIAEYQKDFLDKGVNQLKPLVLRDIAEKIGVHESTVSRATNGKYVHTPQGIFELKYFFNTGLSNSAGGDDFANETVKQLVRQIIGSENNRSPLSDQAIVALLKNQNITIARRTVAKYREMLGILPSSRRRQHF
jgi:RNA polymerase sigma-54 factor